MWLAFLSLVVACNVWLTAGAFEPLREGRAIDFVLVTPPLRHLAAWWLVSAAAIGMLHALLAAVLPRSRAWKSALDWRLVSCWSPLLLLLLPLAAVAAASTRLSAPAAPLVYVGIDMWPWLVVGAVAALVLAFESAAGSVRLKRLAACIGAATPATKAGLWLDVALVAVLVIASLAAAPVFRFQSPVIGDEPKYLRYLENWYRGRGMDITGLSPIAELPPGQGSRVLGNVERVGAAFPVIAGDLAADARRMLGAGAPPRPGPASSKGGWFVEGKRGGVYQVHNPGLSFLLFPGYYVDRFALNWSSRFHPQFPTDLACTNTSLLVLYLLWGVAIFRLLWCHTNRPGLSWLLGGVTMISLPASAFAYQYYPEAAAGLTLALLVRYALLSPATSRASSLGHGLMAGFLPWLHLRLGPVALLIAVFVATTRRRTPSALVMFGLGMVVPLVALGLYYYHISGSVMPWALYALTVELPPFDAARAVRDLPSFLFDSRGGLLAHAPVFLLALPGLWLSWRRNRLLASAVSVLVVTAALLAAGHGWLGGWSTPLRLVAAVVPLLALPVADFIASRENSRWTVATAAVLAAVSVQNGLSYNDHFVRSDPWQLGPVVGGWLSPLLFPPFDTADRAHAWLWVWPVLAVGLLVWPMLSRRTPAPPESGARRAVPWTVALAGACCLLVGAGVAMGIVHGEPFRGDLMPQLSHARSRLIQARLAHPGGILWSARRGAADVRTLLPNPPEATATLRARPEVTRIGGIVTLRLDTRSDHLAPAWGTATVAFGDGTVVAGPFVHAHAVSHSYSAAGDYTAIVDLTLPGRAGIRASARVRVEPEADSRARAFEPFGDEPGVPDGLATAPLEVQVVAATVSGTELDLRCAVPVRHPDDRVWVWLVTDAGTSRRARLLQAVGRSPAAGGADLGMTLSVVPAPADDELVGVVVGVQTHGRPGAWLRSAMLPIRWPPAILTQGAGVSVLPAGGPY